MYVMIMPYVTKHKLSQTNSINITMSSVYFSLYGNASKSQINLIKHIWDVVQQEIVTMNVI